LPGVTSEHSCGEIAENATKDKFTKCSSENLNDIDSLEYVSVNDMIEIEVKLSPQQVVESYEVVRC
jgi:hypothetical protein